MCFLTIQKSPAEIINKYHSILIFNIQKQNKIESDHDHQSINHGTCARMKEGNVTNNIR